MTTTNKRQYMNIIEKKTTELIPYENNPRNNDGAVDAVAASIKEFGFKVPIVIDANGVIVAGHTRLKAAKKLGLETVPCIIADDLSEEQIKAFRLADNKAAELAEWDEELLNAELEKIAEINMSDFGFDDISQYLDETTESEEDDFSEEDAEKAEAITKPGDIWILGEHRLICGDSAEKETLERVMQGELADMVFTDPPYGVSIGSKNKMINDSTWNKKGGRIEEDIENDAIDRDELYKILVAAFTNLRQNGAAEHCSYYVSSPQGGDLCMMMMMMRDAGLPVKHVLIWVKNMATFSLGRLDYDYRHEPIFYTWTKNHHFYGGFSNSVIDDTADITKMTRKELIEFTRKLMHPKDDTVIYEDKPNKSKLHPTMKPVKLIGRFIKNNTQPGEIVIDIFGGSGTTMIACEQLGRKCRMVELDPHYCDVIKTRWEELTGRKAELMQ